MLPRTPLYAICDAEACARFSWTLVDFAQACLDGGATLLQIRAKLAGSRVFLADLIEILARAQPAGATVIVNDRGDLARIAGAHGVHVGQEDLAPEDIRRLAPAPFLVGVSTHSEVQLVAALSEPVDYVAIGPVFDTRTKATGYDPRGLEAVRAAAVKSAAAGLPVVAIGGISLATARSVIDAGAHSVAVISDLCTSGDPAARVREFLRVLA